MRGRTLPRPSLLTLFYTAELIVAAALFGVFVPRLAGDTEILALLIILNSLALLTPISIYGDSQITPGFVLVTGIIILFGPAGAAIASPIEASLGVQQHRFNLKRLAHGSALLTIVHTSGAYVYDSVAPVNPAAFEWQMVPAVALMTIVCFSLNVLLVGVENRLRTGQALRAFWEKHGWIAPNYITLGVIGLALAAAYIALGIAGIMIFVAPALMMRLSMKLYVDKTKDNVAKLEMQNDALRTANIEVRRVSEELRTSYDGTLEALVNALDARDQETKGHSIRVSRYM
ncbi:MAG TPA: hypothetical protein VG845_12970, partial [Dehalococcoidia bacterium]|nr:hypothetical protein [Dehalococcoidia bacterium]